MAVASSSSGERLVAAVPERSIVTSSDGGKTWTERTAGPGARSWQAVVSSADGINLVATDRGTIPPSISPASVYTSSDSGATWVDRTAAVWAAAPNAVCLSVASSDDGNRLFGACQTSVLISADAGATWNTTTRRFNSANAAAASSDGSRLVFADSPGYVYTSSNGGTTWTTGEGAQQQHASAQQAQQARARQRGCMAEGR